MAGKAPLYYGLNKKQIAAEAFHILGVDATKSQVAKHFKLYGLGKCEVSMFHTVKAAYRRQLEAEQTPPLENLTTEPVLNNELHESGIVALVKQAKKLAEEAGGFDQLVELLNVLK